MYNDMYMFLTVRCYEYIPGSKIWCRLFTPPHAYFSQTNRSHFNFPSTKSLFFTDAADGAERYFYVDGAYHIFSPWRVLSMVRSLRGQVCRLWESAVFFKL